MTDTKFVIDLSKVRIGEYRELANSQMGDAKGDAVLGKAAGLTADEINALPFNDYRRLLKAFFKASSEPLADPT